MVVDKYVINVAIGEEMSVRLRGINDKLTRVNDLLLEIEGEYRALSALSGIMESNCKEEKDGD